MNAFLLLELLSIQCMYGYTQTQQDSVLNQAAIMETVHSASNPTEKAIEVYKLNSNKVFRIDKTRNVWVQCLNKKGKSKIKKAKIVDISDHEMTFQPFNKNFSVITYSDLEIQYIGFNSAGRIVIGYTAYFIAIVMAPLILYIAVMAYKPISQDIGPKPNYSWAPGVRNIILKDYPDLKTKWGIRIVESN